MGRAVSVAFAALPFAFGAIRAVKTGSDVRYLWVALAAAIGALVVERMAPARHSAGALSLATLAFCASGAAGTGAAMLLGTKLGPGILVVAASFAACFAAAILTRRLHRSA